MEPSEPCSAHSNSVWCDVAYCLAVIVSQQPLGSRNLGVSILLLTHVGCRVELHNGTFSFFKVTGLHTGAVKRILGLSSQVRNVVT